MSRSVASLMAAAALSAGSMVQAREALDLPRTSPWVFRYDRDACDMTATFGSDANAVSVTFTGYAPEEPLQVTLAGSGMESHSPLNDGWILFGNGEKPRHANVLAAAGAHEKSMLVITEVAMPSFGMAPGKASEIGEKLTFVGPSSQWYRFGTAGFQDALRVMIQCAENLELQWGFKPWEQGARSRPEPVPDFATWLNDADYPDRALASGTSGYLRYRLNVDAEGRVSDCHVQRAIGPDAFGERTCRQLIKRGRFIPARDSTGIPIASYFAGSALFTIR